MPDDDGQKLDRLIRRRRWQIAWVNRLRQIIHRIKNLALTIGGFFV